MLREPTVRIRSVRRSTRNGRINAEEWINRSHRPIASEAHLHAAVQKCAERIGRLAAFVTDPFLRPPSVVNGVIGLNGGDDFELAEASEVLGMHVLCVFYAKATVPRWIRLTNAVEHVQDQTVRAVSDGMDRKLKSCLVRVSRPLFETPVLEDVARESVGCRIGCERLKKQRGR